MTKLCHVTGRLGPCRTKVIGEEGVTKLWIEMVVRRSYEFGSDHAPFAELLQHTLVQLEDLVAGQ